jgi:hypothetical protein
VTHCLVRAFGHQEGIGVCSVRQPNDETLLISVAFHPTIDDFYPFSHAIPPKPTEVLLVAHATSPCNFPLIGTEKLAILATPNNQNKKTLTATTPNSFY